MREELAQIESAIALKEMPSSFDALFGAVWDRASQRFNVQETYILDFKETIPDDFSGPYGVGIARLALAFYNSYGGMIIFGVQDRTLAVVGTDKLFDIEKFNRALTDVAGVHAECLSKGYSLSIEEQLKTIVVLLVPKRGLVRPAKLLRNFGTYKEGTLWVRDRHEALEATLRHVPIVYSERLAPTDSPTDGDDEFPVHRSFPPSPLSKIQGSNRCWAKRIVNLVANFARRLANASSMPRDSAIVIFL